MRSTRAPVVLSEQGARLHRSCLVIDGHNDLPWQLYKNAAPDKTPIDLSQPQPQFHTDIPRLRAGGVGGQFWAAFVPAKPPREESPSRCALGQIDLIHGLARRYPDTFAMAFSAEDIERVRGAGKIASLIGIESGRAIESSLDVLHELHSRGARYMTLSHSETTDWCDSSTDKPQHGGLTPFGMNVVREMNRVGMMVDVAHVSDDAVRDVLQVSRAPVIASHSSADAVAPHPRNLKDDLLKGIASMGGMVMVNFFSGYVDPTAAKVMENMFEIERELHARFPAEENYRKAREEWRKEHPMPRGTVHTVVDHIDYMVRLIGVDRVGLGGDFDGVGVVPEQLDDVSHYPYITQTLLDRGYDEASIRKILGENMLAVMRRTAQAAD